MTYKIKYNKVYFIILYFKNLLFEIKLIFQIELSMIIILIIIIIIVSLSHSLFNLICKSHWDLSLAFKQQQLANQ